MGKSITMSENKIHRKAVTFCFNYTYYDSYTDTINNFIQTIINAAAEYNDNRPAIPSAKYDLNDITTVELPNEGYAHKDGEIKKVNIQELENGI